MIGEFGIGEFSAWVDITLMSLTALYIAILVFAYKRFKRFDLGGFIMNGIYVPYKRSLLNQHVVRRGV